jgi:serine O-acetyltransferase
MVVTCDVPFKNIPASTRFPHPVGIVIGNRVIIGEECIIRQNVTIGTKRWNNGIPEPQPIIGNNVAIGCGAIVLGDIIIEDGATIGAGSFVDKDVPANTTFITKKHHNNENH